MRASLVIVGMGCTLLLLLLPSALALSVTPDELTTTIRQGELAIFHLRGGSNETVTLSASHVGAAGTASTVPLGTVKLDINGTATFAYRAEGELGAVGTWQLLAANETGFVKVQYRVDWDPVFLLEREAARLAEQRAFWTEIQTFVLWTAIVLVVTWIGLRLWHEWGHVRPTHLGKRLAATFGRLRNVASVTEMGIQVATAHPVLANRTAFLKTRRARKRLERVLEERVERDMALLRERDDALALEATYRERVLTDNPGDPLMRDFVEDPGALEAAVRKELGAFLPDGDADEHQEDDDGASS